MKSEWRRPSPADVVYAGLLAVLTFLAVRVWWLSAIVPGQDYPQFLVFVRAAQDCADPASPFHGAYAVAPWYVPTVLPVQLTRAFWVLGGLSLENAGKLLLALQNVGLIAAGAYLLRVLGRPRWAIVLLFPFVHSRWTIVGGFVAYATAFPWILLGWALGVRWLQRLDARSGIAFAAALCVTLLWHGVAFAVLGLGFLVLWLLWRAPEPCLAARALSVAPTAPSLTLFALWTASTFRLPHAASTLRWRSFWEAADDLTYHLEPNVPHATAHALLLAAIVIGSLLVARRNAGAAWPESRTWRYENPFLVVALVFFVAFFVLPVDALGVEVLSPRCSIQAAMAVVFAWNLPARPGPRAAVVGVVAAFSAWTFGNVAACFRAFEGETRGASQLIDRVGQHETLYHDPPQGGASSAFASPNRALIELQQFSTVRHGGLPNSSFAGYGVNYIRYVHGDPMPFLRGAPRYGGGMTRFDYVLARAGQGPQGAGFQLLETRAGWQLYAVCGSTRFPTCEDAR